MGCYHQILNGNIYQWKLTIISFCILDSSFAWDRFSWTLKYNNSKRDNPYLLFIGCPEELDDKTFYRNHYMFFLQEQKKSNWCWSRSSLSSFWLLLCWKALCRLMGNNCQQTYQPVYPLFCITNTSHNISPLVK